MKHILIAIAVLGATAYAGSREEPHDALVQVYACDKSVGYILVQGSYIGSLDTLTDKARQAATLLAEQRRMRLGKVELACKVTP